MKKFAVEITQKLIQHKIISEDDKEIYNYGFWQGMILIVNTVCVLTIGMILGMLWQTLVFTAIYGILRIYAGGYHAGTQGRCFVLSMLLVTLSLSAMKWISWSLELCLLTALLAGIIVLMLAPVEDSNKPLDKAEQKEYRKRTILICLGLAFTLFVFLCVPQIDIAATIAVSIAAVAIMAFSGTMKNWLTMTNKLRQKH